ncbi:hypothetical protein TcG_06190 [Trypanosoma cruzi]|nr:hypothetical protein TcG_06190 [Trypanosoma cruzi]
MDPFVIGCAPAIRSSLLSSLHACGEREMEGRERRGGARGTALSLGIRFVGSLRHEKSMERCHNHRRARQSTHVTENRGSSVAEWNGSSWVKVLHVSAVIRCSKMFVTAFALIENVSLLFVVVPFLIRLITL